MVPREGASMDGVPFLLIPRLTLLSKMEQTNAPEMNISVLTKLI